MLIRILTLAHELRELRELRELLYIALLYYSFVLRTQSITAPGLWDRKLCGMRVKLYELLPEYLAVALPSEPTFSL
jgi:hypothetical protein